MVLSIFHQWIGGAWITQYSWIGSGGVGGPGWRSVHNRRD